jgi:hypothetical protein
MTNTTPKNCIAVWTAQMLTKLGKDRQERMLQLMQMVQLFYVLLMGSNAIIDSGSRTVLQAAEHGDLAGTQFC